MIILLGLCLQVTTPNVVVIAPPASVQSGDLESPDVRAFQERTSVTLTSPLSVDHDVAGTFIGPGAGTPLAPGMVVDSWYLHLDPPGQSNASGTGSITFAQPVLALITQTGTLRASDSVIGGLSTAYPGPAAEPLRGLDSGSGFFPDAVTLTSDRLTVDLVEIRAASASDQLRVVLASSTGSVSCTGNLNSTGSVAMLRATGSNAIADNNLLLGVVGLPAGSFALMVASRTPGFTSNLGGGEGDLCLGGAIGRFTGNIISASPFGAGSMRVDLGAIPQPSALVAAIPGETWFFQCWYRDVTSAGVPTSNLSEAVAVPLQ